MIHENIHVLNFTLQVKKKYHQPKLYMTYVNCITYYSKKNVFIFNKKCIESIVKNCGSKVHQEIATKDFMDLMRNIAGVRIINKKKLF